jgi:tetratricopeptide (TPR) repeat protein
LAPSPDSLTLAIAGWAPSLRIAKALPWNKRVNRDGDFYRAIDDLWAYTARLPVWIKHKTSLINDLQPTSADEAEVLGDIERRRGQAPLAVAHYKRATEIRQRLVLADTENAPLQYRLATVYEKLVAVADAGDSESGPSVLNRVVEFWQKLVSVSHSHQSSRRYLIDFQLRHADSLPQRDEKGRKALLLSQVDKWCEERKGPDDRLVRYGLRELWARLAASGPPLIGDRKAIDDLVERHPELTVIIADQYAADKNWPRAIAIYSKPLTTLSGFEHARKLVALATSGKGKDDPPLDDRARARLRRQALVWLKSELSAATKLVDSGPPPARANISEALNRWEQDSNLASFRSAEALAKLPEDEHTAWQTLWADVDSLMKRAPGALEMTLEGDVSKSLADVHMKAHALEASKPNEAETLFRQALEGYLRTQGPGAELTLDLTRDLANVLDRTGRSAEAEPLFREALERARKLFGPDDARTVLRYGSALGLNLIQQRKWAEAESLMRVALEHARKQFGLDDPNLAAILAPYSLSLMQQGKWAAAEPILRECLAIREKLEPDAWTTFNTRSTLGGSLLGQKKFVLAEPLIIAGYEGMKAREAKIPPQGMPRLADAAARVVTLFEEWGKKDEAAHWRSKLAKAASLPKQ